MTAIYFLVYFSTFLSFAEKCSVMCLLPVLVLLLPCSLPPLEPGSNSWFLLSVTTCPVLVNILHEFTHKHQGYGSSPYFYDIQLFKFNNLPLTFYFFRKATRCRSSEEDHALKGMKEKAKDVEMQRKLSMTYILVHCSPKISLKLILTAYKSLLCQDFPK